MSDDKEIARWTHMWAGAATHTCSNLESIWDNEAVGASIGARDVLSIVLVDAIRNVYRGAVAVLGGDAEPIANFESAQPTLKNLRDRLEHFDDYVVGKGYAQAGRPRRNCTERQPVADPPKGITVVSSGGGGTDGHVVTIKVEERSGAVTYQFASRAATDAARNLAWATIATTGLDDERHHGCPVCVSQ